jgi:predicted MFS family arabinose efflux permease
MTTTAVPGRPQELTRRAINLIFVTILLGILVSALDQTVVSTALPTIVGDLGGAGHVSWVVTSYILTDTIATVLAGKLGDLFGRKRVFQVSMVIFIVGSALSGLAGSMTTLIAWRALQGIGAGGLVLATSLGGNSYPWGSPTIIAMYAVSAAALAGFVFVELRAREPILPMRLFRDPVFSVVMVLAFVVGFALLGAITFLPTYLQYVKGVSATVSGLRTLPMVAGLLITSIATGTLVGRTGRYKIFPVVGFFVMAIGLYLLSRLAPGTGFWATSGSMFVLGIGIGLSMQVLTIIVQNTARYQDLGVATSAVTFFRTLGSSFGAAVFGAIYSNGLASRLRSALAASPQVNPKAITTPETLHRYPDSAIRLIVSAYSDTLHVVFLWAVPGRRWPS